MIRAVVAAAIASAACGPAAPPATHTVYQYALGGPTIEYHPGDTLPLVWKGTPQVVTGVASDERARLCVAIVGPYSDVAGLKASHTTARACPITGPGVAAASDVALADLLVGTAVDQTLVLPKTLAPGFYEVQSVVAYGATETGNSMSSAGILRVVAAP